MTASIPASEMLRPLPPSQKAHNQQASLWDQYAKQIKPYQQYKKVAVLTISWEAFDMDTSEEVLELETVFREYKFEVNSFVFKKNSIAQSQLHRELAQFVHEYQDRRTLLIIYYAGHGHTRPGKPEKNAEYFLAGSYTKYPQKVGNHNCADWTKAEVLLRETLSDVFLIFDACYSGTLCGSRETRAFSYEYLSSCSAGERCPLPGPHSFTRALIRALRTLRSDGPFTTTALLKEIKKSYPTGKSRLTPMLGDHIEQSSMTPIMICSMDVDFDEAMTNKKDKSLHYIDVRFILPKAVTDDIVEEMSKLITEWADERHRSFPIEATRYLGRNPTTFPIELIREVIERWKQYVQSNKLSKARPRSQEQCSSPTDASSSMTASLTPEIVTSQEEASLQEDKIVPRRSSRKRSSTAVELASSRQDRVDLARSSVHTPGFHMALRKRPRTSFQSSQFN